jgi:hypothetical protein
MKTALELAAADAPAPAAARRALISIDGVAKTYRSAGGAIESLKPLSFDIGDPPDAASRRC